MLFTVSKCFKLSSYLFDYVWFTLVCCQIPFLAKSIAVVKNWHRIVSKSFINRRQSVPDFLWYKGEDHLGRSLMYEDHLGRPRDILHMDRKFSGKKSTMEKERLFKKNFGRV